MAIDDVNLVNDYGSSSSVVQAVGQLGAAAVSARTYLQSAEGHVTAPFSYSGAPFTNIAPGLPLVLNKQSATSKILVHAWISGTYTAPAGPNAFFELTIDGLTVESVTATSDANGNLTISFLHDAGGLAAGNHSFALRVSTDPGSTFAAMTSGARILVEEVTV